MISFEIEDEMDEVRDSLAMAGDTLGVKAMDPHNREFYIKDIPFTEEAIEKSDKAIAEAFYSLGLIYAEGLNNAPKSIEAYETLLERFPNDPNTLKVYYQLYRLYMDVGNTAQSDYYKNLITTEYPESDYAKLILDPDYFKKMKAKESELSELYSKTYTAFEKGRYFTVIGNTDRALRTYGDTNELIPKFLYLKALSVGKVDVVDSLAVALKQIITDYPTSDVKPLAQVTRNETICRQLIFRNIGNCIPGIIPRELVEVYELHLCKAYPMHLVTPQPFWVVPVMQLVLLDVKVR